MESRIQIALAVDTPLYAPLYLAKRLAGRGDGLGSDFGIFRRVDFSYKKAPRRDGTDPLVEQVLRGSSYSRNEDACLLAIGDPMRMASAMIEGPGFTRDTPYVIAGLIHQMCFWLIDVSVLGEDISPARAFSRIYVHRKGMTGYSVLAYELQAIDLLGDEEVARVLKQCSPGTEKIWYETENWPAAVRGHAAQMRGRERRGVAYLAADPFMGARATHASTWRRSHQTVREYHAGEDRLKHFRHALMTGAIVSKDLYERDRNRKQEIDDIIGCVDRAIALIAADPDLAAHYLLDYADERMSFPRTLKVERELGSVLEKFVVRDVYNRQEGLRCGVESIRKAIEIRKLSMRREAEFLDKVAATPEEYFEVQSAQVKKAQESPVEVVPLWRRALEEERQQNALFQSHRKWALRSSWILVILVVVALEQVGNSETGLNENLAGFIGIFSFSLLALPALRDLAEVLARLRGGGGLREVSFKAGLISVLSLPLLTFLGLRVLSALFGELVIALKWTESNSSILQEIGDFVLHAVKDGHIELVAWTVGLLVLIVSFWAWCVHERRRHGFSRLLWKIGSRGRRGLVYCGACLKVVVSLLWSLLVWIWAFLTKDLRRYKQA